MLRESLKGYKRVVLADVCSQKQIDTPTLSVWVRDGGQWQELSNRDVLRMWQKSGSKSFCQIMLREFFGLNAVQYQIIKRKFNDPRELSGIYSDAHFTDFIIVADLPSLVSTGNLVAGAGATAAAVGTGVYMIKRRQKLQHDAINSTGSGAKHEPSTLDQAHGVEPALYPESQLILVRSEAVNDGSTSGKSTPEPHEADSRQASNSERPFGGVDEEREISAREEASSRAEVVIRSPKFEEEKQAPEIVIDSISPLKIKPQSDNSNAERVKLEHEAACDLVIERLIGLIQAATAYMFHETETLVDENSIDYSNIKTENCDIKALRMELNALVNTPRIEDVYKIFWDKWEYDDNIGVIAKNSENNETQLVEIKKAIQTATSEGECQNRVEMKPYEISFLDRHVKETINELRKDVLNYLKQYWMDHFQIEDNDYMFQELKGEVKTYVSTFEKKLKREVKKYHESVKHLRESIREYNLLCITLKPDV
jgi:hypothetical protein